MILGIIRFFLETFFELVICSCVGFLLLDYSKGWTNDDYFAFIIAAVMFGLGSLFLAFIFWWTLIGLLKVHRVELSRCQLRHCKILKAVREQASTHEEGPKVNLAELIMKKHLAGQSEVLEAINKHKETQRLKDLFALMV